jgi:hypothetical protein
MKTTLEWSCRSRSCVTTLLLLSLLAPLAPPSRARDAAREGDARKELEVRSWREGAAARETERTGEPRKEGDRKRDGDREGERPARGDGDREGEEREGDRPWQDDRDGERERRGEAGLNLEAIVRDGLSRLPPREREEAMLLLRENYQWQLREAQRLADKQPDEAAERVERLVDEAVELSQLRHENPEQFARHRQFRQAENQAAMLAARAREARGAEREQAMAELRQTLQRAFELKQQNLAREVETMNRHLAELRSLLEKRQANRDAIINRRAYQLVGEQDYLEW